MIVFEAWKNKMKESINETKQFISKKQNFDFNFSSTFLSPLYIFKFIFHIYIVRFNEIINKNNLA